MHRPSSLTISLISGAGLALAASAVLAAGSHEPGAYLDANTFVDGSFILPQNAAISGGAGPSGIDRLGDLLESKAVSSDLLVTPFGHIDTTAIGGGTVKDDFALAIFGSTAGMTRIDDIDGTADNDDDAGPDNAPAVLQDAINHPTDFGVLGGIVLRST